MNNFIRISASSVLLFQAFLGYADDVIIPSGTNLELRIFGSDEDDIFFRSGDRLILPDGNVVSGVGDQALYIDINDKDDDEDVTYIELDIIIDGDVLSDSYEGFKISDSDGADGDDVLKGDITINRRLRSDGGEGLNLNVPQEGNIIINGSVEGGNKAIDLANRDRAMVGTITNNGKILSSSGTGIDSSGAITGGIYNYGLIDAAKALEFTVKDQSDQITNYVYNYGEIEGNITSSHNHHAYIINRGDVAGDVLFDTSVLSDTGNTAGINTLENYGSINSSKIEATIKNNGQINVGQLVLHGDSFNSNSLNVTQLLNIGTHTFNNTGRLSVQQISGSGIINNKGLIYVNKGSELESNNLNNIGGAIEVNFGDSFTGTGFTTSAIVFDDQSKIILDFDKDAFENTQAGTVNVMSAMDYNGENVAIEKGGLFFDILSIDYDNAGNSISADIEVLSPQTVVNKHSGGGANEALFATSMLSEDGAHGTLSAEYGSIYDISSAEELSAYINNIMPGAREMHNQVLGTISSLTFDQINHRSTSLNSGVSTGDAPDSHQFWIRGLHGNGDHDKTASTTGFDFEVDGFTLGFDKNFGEHTAGLMLSIGNSQINTNRDEAESITTYSAGIYDIWQHEALFLNTAMSLGVSNHNVSRLKGAAEMRGSYRSSYADINIQGGYRYMLSGIQLDPMFRLSGRWVNSEDFSLSNDGSNVTEHHGENSVKQFETGLGGAISKNWMFRGWMVEPKLSLMCVTDLARDEKQQNITFSGNDYIGLQIDKEHNYLLTSVDMKLNRSDNLDVILSYQRRTNKVSTYTAFSARFNFSF